LPFDEAHVLGVESTDPYDPVPVTDIAVIENQIARGSVVADVVDLGVVAGGNPAMVNGLGSLATFSTWLKSRNRKVSGSWSMRSWAVGLSAS